MNENIDPNLIKKFNDKLKEAGMPEELEIEKVPVNVNSATGILIELVPEIEESLGRFKILNPKIQEDILADLKNQRETGMSASKILERFEVLVMKGEELENMTPDASDKKEKREDVKETYEIDRANEDSQKVDKLISEIEFFIRRDNHIPGRSTH